MIYQNDLVKLTSLIHSSVKNSLIRYKNLDFFSTDIDLDKLRSYTRDDNHGSLIDILNFLNTDIVFGLSNRKYLGSKSKLIRFIGKTILNITGKHIESFFDPFAGTGIVAHWMRQYADKVIANDILFSNFLGLRTFISATPDKVSVLRLNDLIDHCNSIKPIDGYVFSNFADTYFTAGNARKIDAVREEISRLYREKECTLEEKYALLLSLLYAMDKCANTVGQYDAFLKHIGSDVMVCGTHRIDSNVYKPLILKRPFFFFDEKNEVFQCHANQLVGLVKAEVIYLDPPYNHRQYIDCYHLLENVMLWNKPVTIGKTKKFKRDHLKSDYSRKTKAAKTFSALIKGLQCRHIFLSYNSEGIISDKEICEILKTRGKLDIFEKDYRIFGNGAGVSRKRPIKERLFYVRVEK